MNSPILSIITVNLNNRSGLSKTLESVKKQTFNPYEHIVIDGGSTDGSLDLIQRYAKEADKLTYWVSEKDNGIYDAMNKGIRKAKGSYLLFLNSGDYLNGNVLAQIPFGEGHYICGDIKVYTGNRSFFIHSPEKVDLFHLSYDSLPHQACFIHRDLFLNHEYDTNYLIVSDWIHCFQTLIFESHTYKHISLVISCCEGNGIGSCCETNQQERELWMEHTLSPVMWESMKKISKLGPAMKKFEEEDIYEYLRSDFYDLIPKLNATSRFQKRAKRLVLFLYKINNLVSFKKRTK